VKGLADFGKKIEEKARQRKKNSEYISGRRNSGGQNSA